MAAAPKDAAHAAAPRRLPLLRGVLRVYRALFLTVLTGLVGAILLVPLLRNPANYVGGLQGEWTLAGTLASQAPIQLTAASAILVAFFALSWLSDHMDQRAIQSSFRHPTPVAQPAPPAPPAHPMPPASTP